ncbi:hypothetical protein AAV98_06440 [Bacillus sp. CHD6a]|nr:hypothetical protein AAV98_06440 [Bacillus sp. CHD6a]
METPQAKPRRLTSALRKAKPFAEINSGVSKNTKIKTFSVATVETRPRRRSRRRLTSASRKAKPLENNNGVLQNILLNIALHRCMYIEGECV